MGSEEFNIIGVCEPCTHVVHLINTVVIATSVVGTVSFFGTMCVIVVIVAYVNPAPSFRECGDASAF
jgi:hypothetical protein